MKLGISFMVYDEEIKKRCSIMQCRKQNVKDWEMMLGAGHFFFFF